MKVYPVLVILLIAVSLPARSQDHSHITLIVEHPDSLAGKCCFFPRFKDLLLKLEFGVTKGQVDTLRLNHAYYPIHFDCQTPRTSSSFLAIPGDTIKIALNPDNGYYEVANKPAVYNATSIMNRRGSQTIRYHKGFSVKNFTAADFDIIRNELDSLQRVRITLIDSLAEEKTGYSRELIREMEYYNLTEFLTPLQNPDSADRAPDWYKTMVTSMADSLFSRDSALLGGTEFRTALVHYNRFLGHKNLGKNPEHDVAAEFSTAIAQFKGTQRSFLLAEALRRSKDLNTALFDSLLPLYLSHSENELIDRYVWDKLYDKSFVFPDFVSHAKLKDLKGRSLTWETLMEQNKDYTILVDFWASWCPPCFLELPDLKRLGGRFFNDSLVIVAVSIDDNTKKWKRGLRYYNERYRHKSHYLLDMSKANKKRFMQFLFSRRHDEGPPVMIPRYMLLNSRRRIFLHELPRPLDSKQTIKLVNSVVHGRRDPD